MNEDKFWGLLTADVNIVTFDYGRGKLKDNIFEVTMELQYQYNPS